MKYYNLNFNKLVQLLLPTFLRKPRIIAYLQCAFTPLIGIYDEFKQLRLDDHYKLDHTWQKCYMEAVLNDMFDLDERKIRIIEGDRYERNYIYTHAEQKPKYLGTLFLRRAEDYSDTGYDFTVDMANVTANHYDVVALVKFYKLEGTRFNIINLRTLQRISLNQSIRQ